MDHVTKGPCTFFKPEAVDAMNRAYEKACRSLLTDRSQEELRFKLADHMMTIAKQGETDERRLHELSLAAVLGNGAQ